MATISYISATRVYPGASTASVDDLNLEVEDGEFMGDGATDKRWVMRSESRAVPTIGSRVRVALRGDEAHAFNPEAGLRLG